MESDPDGAGHLERRVTFEEWDKLTDKLFNKLFIHEWNEKNNFDKKGTYMQPIYNGICFVFNHVKSLYVGNITIENPVLYGMDISFTEDFTIENIQFE